MLINDLHSASIQFEPIQRPAAANHRLQALSVHSLVRLAHSPWRHSIVGVIRRAGIVRDTVVRERKLALARGRRRPGAAATARRAAAVRQPVQSHSGTGSDTHVLGRWHGQRRLEGRAAD